MRPRYVLMTAAALAIGGYAFGPQVLAQDDPARGPAERTGQQIDDAADRAGDAIRRGTEGTVAAPDAEGIRDVLAQVAEASITKGGLDDLVERFVDADRNRLGESDVLKADNEQLDGIIAQFRQNWQARYNTEFDIKDEDAVFNQSFASIIQGEIGEGARLAGERQPGAQPGITPDTPPDRDPQADPGAAPGAAPGPESDRIAGGDTNREPGRNIATVRIQESHGLPALTVPMIQEFPDSWKVDVPETVSAEQLRSNLETVLTKLNENHAQWPADEQEAYRHVTHKILLAVMGQQDALQQQPDDMQRTLPGEGPGMDRPNQPAQPGQMGQPGEPAQPR